MGLSEPFVRAAVARVDSGFEGAGRRHSVSWAVGVCTRVSLRRAFVCTYSICVYGCCVTAMVVFLHVSCAPLSVGQSGWIHPILSKILRHSVRVHYSCRRDCTRGMTLFACKKVRNIGMRPVRHAHGRVESSYHGNKL